MNAVEFLHKKQTYNIYSVFFEEKTRLTSASNCFKVATSNLTTVRNVVKKQSKLKQDFSYLKATSSVSLNDKTPLRSFRLL